MRLLTPLLFLLLAGCGFHLQGSAPAQSELPQFTVTGLPGTHALVQELEQQRSLYRQDDKRQRRIQISQPQWQQRAISYAADGTAVEYELRLELNIEIYAEDEKQLLQFPVSISGDYSFSPALILSKSIEEKRLREELVQRAAATILRRLAYQ